MAAFTDLIESAVPWVFSAMTATISVLAYRRAGRGVEIANAKGELDISAVAVDIDGKEVKLASESLDLYQRVVEMQIAAQEERFTLQFDELQRRTEEYQAAFDEATVALVDANNRIAEHKARIDRLEVWKQHTETTINEFLAVVNGDPVPKHWQDRLAALTTTQGDPS